MEKRKTDLDVIYIPCDGSPMVIKSVPLFEIGIEIPTGLVFEVLNRGIPDIRAYVDKYTFDNTTFSRIYALGQIGDEGLTPDEGMIPSAGMPSGEFIKGMSTENYSGLPSNACLRKLFSDMNKESGFQAYRDAVVFKAVAWPHTMDDGTNTVRYRDMDKRYADAKFKFDLQHELWRMLANYSKEDLESSPPKTDENPRHP